MSGQRELEIPKAFDQLDQEVERHVAGLARGCGRLVMEYAEAEERNISVETWEQPEFFVCGDRISFQASQVRLGKKTLMPSAGVIAGFSYTMRPGGCPEDVDRKTPDISHIVVSGRPDKGWADNIIVAFNTAGHTEGSVVRSRNHKNMLPPVVPEAGAWGDPKENFGYACALQLATARTGANIVAALLRKQSLESTLGLDKALRAGDALMTSCVKLAGKRKVDFLDADVTIEELLGCAFVRSPGGSTKTKARKSRAA